MLDALTWHSRVQRGLPPDLKTEQEGFDFRKLAVKAGVDPINFLPRRQRLKALAEREAAKRGPDEQQG